MSCADIRDEGYVYNPPSEDKGLVLRVALGCSHNACTFCGMYRNVGFRIRDLAEILPEIRETRENKPNLKRVFLGDGNALAAPTEQLLPILQRLKATFPMLATISCAARADDLLAKSVAELAELRAAGLSLVYLGVESGDDEVLRSINKGVSAADVVRAGQAADAAGIDLSTMIILGLGGKKRSEQHALNTAAVLNALSPAMLGIMTLLPRTGTPLERLVAVGQFERLDRKETLQELLLLLQRLEVRRPAILRASHLFNHLALEGDLPEDKAALIGQVQAELQKDPATAKELSYKNYGIF